MPVDVTQPDCLMTLSPASLRPVWRRGPLFAFTMAAVTLMAGCDGLPASKDAPGAASAPAAPLAIVPSSDSEPAAPAPVAAPASPQGRSDQARTAVYKSQQLPPVPVERESEKARRVSIYTPPPGSPERVALMNSLRASMRSDLGTSAVFMVQTLRSNGEWAFGVVEPTHQDGRPIDIAKTPIYRNSSILDGLRTEVIWRKDHGRWTIIARETGATDVWWISHCGRAPRGIITGC